MRRIIASTAARKKSLHRGGTVYNGAMSEDSKCCPTCGLADCEDFGYCGAYMCPECEKCSDGMFGLIWPPLRARIQHIGGVVMEENMYGLVCPYCDASLLGRDVLGVVTPDVGI